MKIIGIKDTQTRKNLYIEVFSKKQKFPDGKNGILDRISGGILGQVIDAHKPLIPKNGGVGEQNFVIITPTNEYFYAFDYSKDLEGWQQQIEKGVKILGVRLAKIVNEKYFVISNDVQYRLEDCEFERYNFKFQDEDGEWKTNKERERINKKELFPDYTEKNKPYKIYQGKDYTEEEWKVFEEEEYRKYVEKRNAKKSPSLADGATEKKNFSAESGTLKEVQYFVMHSKQERVPVYEFPSAMVAPFTFLENGIAIDVTKYEEEGWCEILSKDGKKGYIQSSYVKKNN